MSSKSKMKVIILWFSVIISCELSLAQINAVIPQPVVCPQGIGGQCVQQQTVCQQGISGQCIQQPAVCQHGISGHCIQQPTVCQHGVSGHCIQQPICTSQSICSQPPCAIPCAPVIPVPIPLSTTPQPPPYPQPHPQNNGTNHTTIIYIDKTTPGTHEKLERLSDSDTSVSLTLTNIVHTNNTIYVPVNITNHNVINTPVYISNSEHVEDGGGDPQTDRPRPKPRPTQHKCCSVISPRICHKVISDWSCSHKKYRRCGSFCVAPKIYLRTHEMQFRESRLYVPPLRTRPRYVPHGSLDCSGCMSGMSHHCSEGCFTQTHCTRRQGCQYQDQEQFCSEFGGEGCTEEDGYVEGNASNEEEELDLNYTIN